MKTMQHEIAMKSMYLCCTLCANQTIGCRANAMSQSNGRGLLGYGEISRSARERKEIRRVVAISQILPLDTLPNGLAYAKSSPLSFSPVPLNHLIVLS